MPKINEPVMLVSTPVTAGNSMRTPLLSEAKKTTGLATWSTRLSVVIVQDEDVAILSEAAYSQNAICAQTAEVVFFGTVAGTAGRDISESGAADYLDGQIFGVLAGNRYIRGVDWSPSKAINEGQALDDGIAAGTGLLGKRNGKS